MMEAPVLDPNFFDPAVQEDPFGFYQTNLLKAPVFRIAESNAYVVLSNDLINEATQRIEDFSNDVAAILAGQRSSDPDIKAVLDKGWPQRQLLLLADPPDHTRSRKLVNLAFSSHRVNAMEAYIRSIVVGLIEAFIDKSHCEFVKDFAIPLPVAVIAEQIGFTRADTDTVKRWSDAFADRLGGLISREREMECAHEVVEFQHAMVAKIEERRAVPQDDLLSDLVRARIGGERPLDDGELLSVLQQLMVAGNETTTSTLSGGLLLLMDNPDQMAIVREDPGVIPNMVEEMLRLEAPSAGNWRVVPRDTELGGVKIPGGSMLMLRWAAGNRDPSEFTDGDRFDVRRRNARNHMAFGRGIHMCVGNMLARKELVIAFQELIARLGDIAVACPQDELTHMPNVVLRGLRKLPVSFTRR